MALSLNYYKRKPDQIKYKGRRRNSISYLFEKEQVLFKKFVYNTNLKNILKLYINKKVC